ncbi:hypothetical protein D1007_51377 [Hordeum vulgare]|nr:hypothetical protein D1007_51377 [Hordeum vulgare]
MSSHCPRGSSTTSTHSSTVTPSSAATPSASPSPAQRARPGTYCFHTATRDWSKAGDWIMMFHGKTEYVRPGARAPVRPLRPPPHSFRPLGLARGEEPLPHKLRIWEDDDLPEEWQLSELCDPKIISLGSGRFLVADLFSDMKFDEDSSEMVPGQQFALFTR